MGRTCKLHTERPRLDSNREPSCSEATVLPTGLCIVKYFHRITFLSSKKLIQKQARNRPDPRRNFYSD
uniref:Uncharacterized protein n=1 Tax=Anguilla anguilla TaxID=7936 RepID=A0A0E9W3G4_ANGAN